VNEQRGPQLEETMKRHAISLMISAFALMGPMPAAAQTPSSAPVPATADEVRELRAAFERARANQAEMQRLAVTLNVHQTRMLQLDTQLQDVRKGLAAFAPALAALRRLVDEARDEAANGATADARSEAADLLPMFERQLDAAVRRDDEGRAQEKELARLLESEDAEWTALANQLSAMTMQ
jgi:hypothetical protein